MHDAGPPPRWISAVLDCYDHPAYCEIAFAFRDLPAECAVLQMCMRRFSTRPLRRMLDLACGPAPHLAEFARLGVAFVGLDESAAMLAHARAKADALGADATFIRADMSAFTLDEPVDLAFTALGSLYVRSSAQLRAHFDAVADALAPGGLYFLDWCVQFEPQTLFKPGGERWEMAQGVIRVQARVEMAPTHPAEQLFEERLTLEVDDAGAHHRLQSRATKRALYPQEFLALIAAQGRFDFIGWWNAWDLAQPITAATQPLFRPIALLRRR